MITEYHKPNTDPTKKIKETPRDRRPKNIGNLITVVHDVNDIKMGLAEMCSVNLMPFHQLRNSGFSRIMAPIIQQSRKCKIPLSTQPEALHAYSDAEFVKMQDIIKDELRGKLFSLMVDATTTQNRSILGISVQYTQNDVVVVRTLAMRRSLQDSTAISLSHVIKTVLFEYGVNTACVYTMTTDNESSIQKCVRDTAVIAMIMSNISREIFRILFNFRPAG